MTRLHVGAGIDKADDNVVVKLTGNQTIAGIKTFSSSPVVPTPSGSTDAATKGYVDGVATGLDLKQSVRVATTANITLSGEQTIDDVAVVAGDRVLVKDQTTGSQNGIYVAALGAWSRSTDADTSGEVTTGLFTLATEGSSNGAKGFVLITSGTITLGTTALVFTQFNQASPSSDPPWVNKAATVSLVPGERRIFANPPAPITITLPTGVSSGYSVLIKNLSPYVVSVIGGGGSSIDGASGGYQLAVVYAAAQFSFGTANWFVASEV